MVWRNIDAIIEGRLYLGNLTAAKSTRSLMNQHISHIVSVCADPIPAEAPQSGIVHMRIPIPDVDYADLLIHLPGACRFIAHALASGGVVLVHCDEGRCRSAAVVAAYLMYARRIPLTTALDIIRHARDQIWVNPGFHEQLYLFQVCQYAPHPGHGVYQDYRRRIQQRLTG